ncbi:MAG: coproporphyrinogen III oxidase family protein [Deltaproteobacteria bacterium]|nr:coproporphyrinogen III oxidase family protein [Deltaproteobacteria bacterium]
MINLEKKTPYQGYLYSYPHKTAYREFETPISLKKAWSDENRSALFFYLHIPFCESKCGFCNLFSVCRPDQEIVDRYLVAVEKQIEAVKEYLGVFRCARYAIGGGTPSYLTEKQLEKTLDMFGDLTGFNSQIPGSFETSPGTLTKEKLKLLKERGVQRISIGVQSFNKSESSSISRSQNIETVHASLEAISNFNFKTLNIDLIYGISGQTSESFCDSIKTALKYEPEELYLYPLYIRTLTKLKGKKRSDEALLIYESGRDFLLENGYNQNSMRMFVKNDSKNETSPNYCCQEDGMIGLGTGARSYTKNMHYSTPYAVSKKASLDIIESFINRTSSDHSNAEFGFMLDENEKKRRYLIKSILQSSGLDKVQYESFFNSDFMDDFPELANLAEKGFADISNGTMKLTQTGIAYSDAIGPALISSSVRDRMKEYENI